MKKTFAFAALAITLAACSSDDNIAYTNEEIKIHTTIGSMTRTVLDGNSTKFVANDELRLYAWDGTLSATSSPWINGVAVKLNSENKWVPASQILWKTAETAHDFLAVYPSSLVNSLSDLTTCSYTMKDDGNVIDNDILRAYSPAVKMPADNTLNLPFKHLMAKIQVNLKFRTQWETTPTVTSVTGSLAKAANINFISNGISPDRLAAATPSRAFTVKATPATGYVYSYEIIAVPDDPDFKTINIAIDNNTYTFEYTDPNNGGQSSIALESGKVTTINLIVGHNKVELDMDNSDPTSGTGIFISDWTDQDDNYSGDAYVDNN